MTGSVSYDPTPLEFPVEGEVLTCCARSDTDIVLDM
jgi:hypothetical protein